MAQKIDVHGIFIDPETITDLQLQKRTAVYYPVFHEVAPSRSFFGRRSSSQHILRFESQQPYGIILKDEEQPNPMNFIMNYQQFAIERLLRGVQQTTKNITGHIAEAFKIEVAGDQQYRMLQPSRNVKQISIREIPAKVQLLSGQWVDVFKSTPDYEFQGGTPYPVTDVPAYALLIRTREQIHVLFGAGIDVTDQEVVTSYQALTDIYNQIQANKESGDGKGKPLFQMPQINIQLPKVELPKIEIKMTLTLSWLRSAAMKQSIPMGRK